MKILINEIQLGQEILYKDIDLDSLNYKENIHVFNHSVELAEWLLDFYKYK